MDEQSAVAAHSTLVGPLGWFFAAIAAGIAWAFYQLWTSTRNTERVKMERELKQARKLLVDIRTENLHLSQRNQELRNEVDDLREQNRKLTLANEHLEKTVNEQGMLISALTDRVNRNEKLIIKLYTDLGRDVDLKYIGGNVPEGPKERPDEPTA